MSDDELEVEDGDELESLSYEDLVEEEPEREIDFGDVEAPKSLTEAEEETVHRTDIQAILRQLIPKLPNKRMNDLLQPALVSRVFPDNYTDKHFLLSAALIEEQSPDEDVDVVGIISIVQDILSKAYEGRHIADLLELAGAAQEEEMDKLTRDMGL
jgi:hypothetical protein